MWSLFRERDKFDIARLEIHMLFTFQKRAVTSLFIRGDIGFVIGDDIADKFVIIRRVSGKEEDFFGEVDASVSLRQMYSHLVDGTCFAEVDNDGNIRFAVPADTIFIKPDIIIAELSVSQVHRVFIVAGKRVKGFLFIGEFFAQHQIFRRGKKRHTAKRGTDKGKIFHNQ